MIWAIASAGRGAERLIERSVYLNTARKIIANKLKLNKRWSRAPLGRAKIGVWGGSKRREAAIWSIFLIWSIKETAAATDYIGSAERTV